MQTVRVSACDLCACYMPGPESAVAAVSNGVNFFTAVSENYSRFGSLRDNGVKVPNPTGQYENSFNTQFVVGASFWDDKLSLQLTLPWLYRSFRRPEGFAIDQGHESGIGDMSLLANYRLFAWGEGAHEITTGDGKKAVTTVAPESPWSGGFHVFAGMKLPTGNPDRIAEEFSEVDVPGAPESGIHGHDLALGTGSFDGIFGAQFFTRYKSLFLEADGQFTWRGVGSSAIAMPMTSPGMPVLAFTCGATATAAWPWRRRSPVNTKARTPSRASRRDTGITAVYFGPRVMANFGHFSADVGADWPIVINNTSFQAVVDYRLHAAVSYHF